MIMQEIALIWSSFLTYLYRSTVFSFLFCFVLNMLFICTVLLCNLWLGIENEGDLGLYAFSSVYGQLHFTSYYELKLIYIFFWVFVSIILTQSNIYFLEVKNKMCIRCMLIKINDKVFHWLLLRDHFKPAHGTLHRKLSG